MPNRPGIGDTRAAEPQTFRLEMDYYSPSPACMLAPAPAAVKTSGTPAAVASLLTSHDRPGGGRLRQAVGPNHCALHIVLDPMVQAATTAQAE